MRLRGSWRGYALPSLLILGSLWTTSLGADAPRRIHLERGDPVLEAGEFYPTAEAAKLLVLMTERRLRAEVAEERLRASEEAAALYEARVSLLQAELEEARADTAIAKARLPGFWEKHLGFCGGITGAYSVAGGDATFGLGMTYGYKW